MTEASTLDPFIVKGISGVMGSLCLLVSFFSFSRCLIDLQSEASPTGDGFPTDGITLKEIKHFISSHGGEQAFASAWSDYSRKNCLPPGKTSDICDVFLKPATVAQQESYCGLAKTDPTRSGHIGQATAFVSHAWGQQFLDVVAALEAFEAKQPTPTIFLVRHLLQQPAQGTQPRVQLVADRV